MAPSPPCLDGFEKLENLTDIQLGDFTVSVSNETGALIRLYDELTEREWCDELHPLGRMQYDVYNTSDYDAYRCYAD